MNETPLTVVGNIVNEPELRFVPSGAAVCNFRIASTPRRYDKQRNEWVDGDPLFLGVNVWRQHAENAAETLRKGMRVIVVGTLRQQQFEKKDGTKGSSYEIADAEVAVSLKNATAVVTKTSGQNRAQQPAQGGYAQQQPPADPWAQQQQGYSNEPPF